MYFRDVIGHEQIIERLILNAKNQRISHAQLFLGNQGNGTLALALAYARYVQCRNRSDQDACGTCPSCLKFNKFEHPDLHFIFPSAPNKEHKEKVSSKLFLPEWRKMLCTTSYFDYYNWLEAIGIENKQAIINAEDCNDIIRTLGLKAYESPYKIIIMYMVEKLSYQAAPKLLKIMEEPPEGTLFLLISENKDRIINTILSRTQIIKVPPPGEEEVKKALVEKHGMDVDTAAQITFVSGGIFTEAIKLAEEGEHQLADFNSFREWMRLCYKNESGNILKWVEKTAQAGREKQKSFCQYGLNIFRMCLLHNYKAADLIRFEGEELDFLNKFSRFIHHNNAIEIVDSFNDAIFHIERNANPKVLFADLSFKMHRLMHAKTA